MGPSQEDIGHALARLGNYRVERAQVVANEGRPDGISGALVLALGMRETWGRNIEGGAKLDSHGTWVPLDPKNPGDAARMDVGWTQINRGFHHDALARMPGVLTGTWGPVIKDHNPTMAGIVPRFEEALRFTVEELRENAAYAMDHGVPANEAIHVAVAAHNAGVGGALRGWQAGNCDKYTAGGDYSKWVLAARRAVNQWLGSHPNWVA
jgi:hypothetical protein